MQYSEPLDCSQEESGGVYQSLGRECAVPGDCQTGYVLCLCARPQINSTIPSNNSFQTPHLLSHFVVCAIAHSFAVTRLNEVRDDNTIYNNRVDTTLADVFNLLSLFYLTIGKTRECPATYSQIASMRVSPPVPHVFLFLSASRLLRVIWPSFAACIISVRVKFAFRGSYPWDAQTHLILNGRLCRLSISPVSAYRQSLTRERRQDRVQLWVFLCFIPQSDYLFLLPRPMLADPECDASRGDPALYLSSLFARLRFLPSTLGLLRTSCYLSIFPSRALCSSEIRVWEIQHCVTAGQCNCAFASSRLLFTPRKSNFQMFPCLLCVSSCEEFPFRPMRHIQGTDAGHGPWRFRSEQQGARLFSDSPVRADRRFRKEAAANATYAADCLYTTRRIRSAVAYYPCLSTALGTGYNFNPDL